MDHPADLKDARRRQGAQRTASKPSSRQARHSGGERSRAPGRLAKSPQGGPSALKAGVSSGPSAEETANLAGGGYTVPRAQAEGVIGYTAIGYGASGPGLFGPHLFAWSAIHDRAPVQALAHTDTHAHVHDRAIPAGQGSWPVLDRPLRVVHVGPSLARGGAESWLIDLARFLDPARTRIERTVVVEPATIDPSFVPHLPLEIDPGGPEAVRRWARSCDVLLAWGVCLDDILDDDHRPPLCVYVAHGEGDFTRHRLERSLRYTDHIVAVSERVRRHACQGATVPVTVIPNGVDTARLATTGPREAVRRGLGITDEDFVLGYLGRLSPEKQVPLLIEAVAGLPAPFKSLVVGWGPMLPELLAMANRVIPGRFAFVTAAEYLGDYYRAMDAFVLPSREEGAPLALIEAMMCGVPPIATPVGIVPEWLIDRVNGLVVAPEAGSIRAAAELLRRHPRWAAGLAAEARAQADRHGHASTMARKFADLFTSLWIEKAARVPSAIG